MKIIYSTLLILLSGCSLFGVNGVEEPNYEVLSKEGDFEIRQYGDFIIAKTPMSKESEDGSSESFRRLFKYITGNNKENKKIPMTAPVITENESNKAGKKIEMTAPVFIGSDRGSMSFVLPERFDLETAPVPNDEQVRIEQQPSKKVAVMRFSGVLLDGDMEARSSELREWMAKKKLKAAPTFVAAGYDPPWTIPYLRRNEIHIEIK